MIYILNLIRWPSLLFATFVMYMTRYFIIKPILAINDFQLQMSHSDFSLLVVSVCALIAAANIINDYFDIQSDRISGVRKVVVGRKISRRSAIILHSVLNIIALSIILYLSLSVGIWKIAILFFIVSGILWFYSSNYKRYFITGNLIVAILTALIPFCVPIFEIPLLNKEYAEILIATKTNFLYILTWISGFSFFIFLNTMMCEINKDIYSMEGDWEHRVNSIPIRLGIPIARNIIISLSLIAIIASVTLYFTVFRSDYYVLTYLFLALVVPYVIYIVSLLRRNSNRKLQLGLIRTITILCISFGFLLHHFFSTLF
ncbi:UbiA family prenyltransferase [Odoribacter sp. OttesenSCG-928-J03]|nr:UbiA family prenyltransferase [Odoribacter sp. OttesenSCG-928-J03]